MNKNLSEIITKVDKVVENLKKEFFGIDGPIDHLSRLITPFIVNPNQFDERPLIINLWGPTGVGKSHMVQRLLEMTDLSDRSFFFDMGEYMASGGGEDLKDKLISLSKEIEGEESGHILVFDEIQHLRTKNEKGHEVANSPARVIWEVIDKGTVSSRDFSNYSKRQVERFCVKAKYALTYGMEVKNNRVLTFKNEWAKMNGIYSSNQNTDMVGDIPFMKLEHMTLFASVFPEYFIDTIKGSEDLIKLVKDKDPWDVADVSEFSMEGRFFREVFEKNRLLSDHNKAMGWLSEMTHHQSPQKIYKMNPLVVIIMGNLDEAYQDNRSQSHDVSVDGAHWASLMVGLSNIKEALLTRFRAEQIARLGHNHIIYPSLPESAYRLIIKKHTKQAEDRFFKTYGYKISFDESVMELMYDEIVAANQGARCVITGISSLLDSYGPQISLLAEKNNNKGSICISYEDEGERYKIKGKSWQDYTPLSLQIRTKKLRVEDDSIYEVAVHEAAHSVIMFVKCGSIPEGANCVANSDYLGMVSSEFKLCQSKSDLENQMVLLLAGTVAEREVFGFENVTSGADSDINKATAIAVCMVRNLGMGKDFKGRTGKNIFPGESYIFTNRDSVTSVEAESEKILDKAFLQTNEIVKENLKTIMELAEVLVNRKRLNHKELKTFFEEKGLEIKSKKSLYEDLFKKALKEK